MEAGITTRLWSLYDVVAFNSAGRKGRCISPPLQARLYSANKLAA
jgi:hypothetical protein